MSQARAEPNTHVALRIQRVSDRLYFFAFSPQTDQPVWVQAPSAAEIFYGDEAAQVAGKLRRRGIPVQFEIFRASDQLNFDSMRRKGET